MREKSIKNSKSDIKFHYIILFLFYLFTALAIIGRSIAFQTENVFVIIIDGVRYSETFGDRAFANVRNMNHIAQEGCVSENFYNDGRTKTLNGINAIVTGDWANFWPQIIGKKLGFNQKKPLFSKKPTIW